MFFVDFGGVFGTHDVSKKVKNPVVLYGFLLLFEVDVEVEFKTVPRCAQGASKTPQEAPKTPPRRPKRRPRRLQKSEKKTVFS